MILGAVQVVRNVADLAPAEAPYAQAGFTRSFLEPALPVHPAKAPLLSGPRPALAMTHLTVPDELPVELTSYAGGPPAGVAPFALEADDGLHPQRVVAPTHDPEASGAFWDLLGARADAQGGRRFAGALAAWRLELGTPEGPSQQGRTTLDADGWVLVTVLTTGLVTDLARLGDSGLLGRATAPWIEEVGGRPIEVAIVEGPAGELVEILQVASRR